MKVKLFKSITAILLAGALTLPLLTASAASDGEAPKAEATAAAATTSGGDAASIGKKEEVVYATLAGTGGAQSVYTVNHFDVKKAGDITDYGNYATVSNLTDTEAIGYEDHTVSFHADKGNFYYQGNMASTNLPWHFNISYKLDGKTMDPEDLAGASGKLEINILTTQNKEVDATFYDNYMLQVALTLDTDKCGNIRSSGATMAAAGKNQIITHTVMPGKDASIKITADVTDFETDGFEISGIPFSMDIETPDTDELTNGMVTLADAVSSLNDGVGKLADGVAELKSGTGQLANGSAEFGVGLNQLSDNSSQLTDSSSQIKTALSQISTSLNGSDDDIDLSSLTKLPKSLNTLATSLNSISGGMGTLKTGFNTAYAALDTAMQAIPAPMSETDFQTQLMALYGVATNPTQMAFITQLKDNYVAAQTVSGTYANVKTAFTSVGTTLDTLSASITAISGGLTTMSTELTTALSGMDITSQLSELTEGMAELSTNYELFHTGLTEYTGGVTQLATGYAELQSGIATLDNGVGTLQSGTNQLHDGTTEMNDEVADLPETMEIEIENMMDEYTGSDFDPVSFTSSKNKDTDFVQFVFTTEGISTPEPEKTSGEEPAKETIVDRFLALFK